MLLDAGDQRDLYAWIEKAAAPICDAEPGVSFLSSPVSAPLPGLASVSTSRITRTYVTYKR
jgi:hypothetical protein